MPIAIWSTSLEVSIWTKKRIYELYRKAYAEAVDSLSDDDDSA